MNNTVLMSQNIFDAEDVMVDTITSLSGCSLLTSAQTAVQKGSTIHSVEWRAYNNAQGLKSIVFLIRLGSYWSKRKSHVKMMRG